MSYRIRVLGKTDKPIPVSSLEESLEANGIRARLNVVEGGQESWARVELLHKDPSAPEDGAIAMIEKDTVAPGSLAEGELEEFSEAVEGYKPESAANWLKRFLPKVRIIYCFEIIHYGADWGDGWEAIHAVQGEIWRTLGGILQADGEGFSNEDGYHILWQFSETSKGLGKWLSWTVITAGSPLR